MTEAEQELPEESMHGYWRETRQPIYSAALILPFILVYEVGIVVLRSNFINGGDAIVRTLFARYLSVLGVQVNSASVVVLAVCFIVWQIKSRGSWAIKPAMLIANFFESLLYAVLLYIVLAHVVQYLPNQTLAPNPGAAAGAPALVESRAEVLVPAAGGKAPSQTPTVQDFVLYCGAGVYEELVFRVMLLGLLMLIFTKLFHMEHAYAAAWAVVIGALIFSGFHHIGGEPFRLGAFSQRAFAGVFFSAIYINRSFGVAAAAHALYDILVGLDHLR